MTEGAIHICSAILCDDYRTENNGKHILIGVYYPVFSVPNFPTDSNFQMALIANIPSGGHFEAQFRLTDHSDDRKMEGKFAFTVDEAGTNVLLPGFPFELQMKHSSSLELEVLEPPNVTWRSVGKWRVEKNETQSDEQLKETE